MTESIKGRKKINRNKITLDFKCAKCDYSMRESHNILESSILDVMNILTVWDESINDHKDSCVDVVIHSESSVIGDLLPIDLAIPLSAIQEG